MAKIDYTGKNVFWKDKNAPSIVWSVGHVHTQENNMVFIGDDDSISSKRWNARWYELKDIKIKIRTTQ